MKKTVLVVVATAVLVSACTTTDTYTGDQKISNTAAGAGLGALAGASLGLLAGGNDPEVARSRMACCCSGVRLWNICAGSPVGTA